MYGLPEHPDLGFLVGQELQQVCMGRHQAILNFNDASVSVESEMAHTTMSDNPPVLYDAIIPAASMLAQFLSCSIVNVTVRAPGTLVLGFSNNESITIYGSNANYESYQIIHGDSVNVV